MKATGYALIGLAGLLCAYVAAAHLMLDADPVERAGTLNATTSSGNYWLALIPAAVSLAVGLYMVVIRERGYRAEYDMSKQQTSWNT